MPQNKSPLEKAIEDITFLKDKAEEGKNITAVIAYGMAVSVCELHLKEQLQTNLKTKKDHGNNY